MLAGLVLCALLFVGYTCDDSYITFRYAQHAAAGEGLVFNPGERVEGYSNPLWTFLLSLALRLGLNVITAAKVLGVASAVGAALFAYGIARRLPVDQPSSPLQPLVIVPLLTAGFAYYAVSGLETPLYCCLLTGAVYCLLLPSAAGQGAMGTLTLAAALTRPEGLLVMLALLGWRALAWRQYDRSQRAAVAASSFLALLGLAAFFLWRHHYFGLWLPNTYYAKPPGAFGGNSLLYPLGYVREFAQYTGAWLWLALGLVWLRRERLAAGAMLLVVLVELALVLHARGDWMALGRFLVPTLPLLVAFGFAGLLRLVPSRLAVGAVLLVGLALNGVYVGEQLRDFRNGLYPQAVMAGTPQQEAGQWLRENFPPQTVLATKRIGGVSYFSDLQIVDMLGLVDRKIATIRHESEARGETEQAAMATEVFSRKPDLIMLCAMQRWDKVPLDQPPPDLTNNLRDVDNTIYAGLSAHGYRFLRRLPQGGSGEYVVYARAGITARR